MKKNILIAFAFVSTMQTYCSENVIQVSHTDLVQVKDHVDTAARLLADMLLSHNNNKKAIDVHALAIKEEIEQLNPVANSTNHTDTSKDVNTETSSGNNSILTESEHNNEIGTKGTASDVNAGNEKKEEENEKKKVLQSDENQTKSQVVENKSTQTEPSSTTSANIEDTPKDSISDVNPVANTTNSADVTKDPIVNPENTSKDENTPQPPAPEDKKDNEKKEGLSPDENPNNIKDEDKLLDNISDKTTTNEIETPNSTSPPETAVTPNSTQEQEKATKDQKDVDSHKTIEEFLVEAKNAAVKARSNNAYAKHEPLVKNLLSNISYYRSSSLKQPLKTHLAHAYAAYNKLIEATTTKYGNTLKQSNIVSFMHQLDGLFPKLKIKSIPNKNNVYTAENSKEFAERSLNFIKYVQKARNQHLTKYQTQAIEHVSAAIAMPCGELHLSPDNLSTADPITQKNVHNNTVTVYKQMNELLYSLGLNRLKMDEKTYKFSMIRPTNNKVKQHNGATEEKKTTEQVAKTEESPKN